MARKLAYNLLDIMYENAFVLESSSEKAKAGTAVRSSDRSCTVKGLVALDRLNPLIQGYCHS